MNIVVDEFNSTIGFTAFNTAEIVTPENELSQFIAGANNTKSVQFKFAASGDYIEKTGLSIDVSNYDYVVLSCYSNFNKNTTGVYKISFNDSFSFDLHLLPYLESIYLRLDDITTIEKIKITYYGTTIDYLICSHCLAVKDELPLDIFLSVKNLIDKELTIRYNKGFLLGTVNAEAGDEEIALNQIVYTNLSYIDRYAVIKIDDGVNSEQHLLMENNENFFTFGKLLDGEAILNNYTNANVYLVIPIRYGTKQKEYNTPSIAITGFDPEPILRGGKVEQVKTTGEANKTNYVRLDDQIYKYVIQVTCIDRIESDNMSFMSQLIRDVIAREQLWINGQSFDIYFNTKPDFIELTETDNPITGLVYSLELEIKEEIWLNEKQPTTTSQKLTVTIQ
jgi:hypothetical protein